MTLRSKVRTFNSFNQYFVNVGTKLAKQIPVHDNNVSNYMSERNLSSMFLLPTTEKEVSSIVKSCKKCLKIVMIYQ